MTQQIKTEPNFHAQSLVSFQNNIIQSIPDPKAVQNALCFIKDGTLQVYEYTPARLGAAPIVHLAPCDKL